jgi:hypothetical protein
MSPLEHYFENLLTMGSDIKGDPNKNALSKEVQETVEICANYIKNMQLYSNAISDDSTVEKIGMLEEIKKEFEGLDFFEGEEPINITRELMDEVKSWEHGVKDCKKLIQFKINKLKENKE